MILQVGNASIELPTQLLTNLEVAIPWKHFTDAGFDISCATENGKQPACDEMMLSGMTGKLLGANAAAKDAYKSVVQASLAFQKPQAWTSKAFSLDKFDLVFLPGGHEKSVRQIIDSPVVHQLLCSYFPKTQKPSSKSVAAICHGVQVLAESTFKSGKSVLHDVKTTALPSFFEQSIYYATKPFLGSYYKTYGPGTPSVQEIVTKRLGDPSQFCNSLSQTP